MTKQEQETVAMFINTLESAVDKIAEMNKDIFNVKDGLAVQVRDNTQFITEFKEERKEIKKANRRLIYTVVGALVVSTAINVVAMAINGG